MGFDQLERAQDPKDIIKVSDQKLCAVRYSAVNLRKLIAKLNYTSTLSCISIIYIFFYFSANDNLRTSEMRESSLAGPVRFMPSG